MMMVIYLYIYIYMLFLVYYFSFLTSFLLSGFCLSYTLLPSISSSFSLSLSLSASMQFNCPIICFVFYVTSFFNIGNINRWKSTHHEHRFQHLSLSLSLSLSLTHTHTHARARAHKLFKLTLFLLSFFLSHSCTPNSLILFSLSFAYTYPYRHTCSYKTCPYYRLTIPNWTGFILSRFCVFLPDCWAVWN